MFPAECDYHRADDLEEALELLEVHADRDPELLAGGQGLVQDMKARVESPEVLVDVGGVEELAAIERDGDAVAVGALATHAELAAAESLRADARVLAEAAAQVADPQVRNRGTIGGNLAEADPAADLPAAVLAAGATVLVRGPDGERSIPAGEFVRGPGASALADDEVLVRVDVPATDGGGAYARKTHPASGYATVGVGARVEVAEGAVAAARVGVTGAFDAPTRLPAVEEALVGAAADEVDVDAAAERATADVDRGRLRHDHAVSGAYRAEVLPAYAGRALHTALERATEVGA